MAEPLAPAGITVRQPQRFAGGAILVTCVYGVALMIPALLAAMAVSVMPLGVGTILIPLLAVSLATVFLPFGFGNPYVARLVRSLPPPEGVEAGSFIVQLTLRPRVRSGLPALLEDTDDVGWLGFSADALVFRGDSISLTVPFAQVRGLRSESIGARGLYLYPRVSIETHGLAGVERLSFSDRGSCWLPTARRRTAELRRRLAARLVPAG